MNNFFYWLFNPRALLSFSLIVAGLLIVLGLVSCAEVSGDMPEVPEHVSRQSKR